MGGRHQVDNAAIAMNECHPFAKPGHQRLVRRVRRFEFACLVRQCVQIRPQQRFEQGFACWEMTQQCGQPDAGPTGDIAHRRIDTILADDVTRDRKQVVIIFSRVGSHALP